MSVGTRAPAPRPPLCTRPRPCSRRAVLGLRPHAARAAGAGAGGQSSSRGERRRALALAPHAPERPPTPQSGLPEVGRQSAYRLDAELADGVVHEDHAILHAHPDAPVRPAALVRPVLVALLLHGISGNIRSTGAGPHPACRRHGPRPRRAPAHGSPSRERARKSVSLSVGTPRPLPWSRATRGSF